MFIPIETPDEVTGGCHQMTVSPTATTVCSDSRANGGAVAAGAFRCTCAAGFADGWCEYDFIEQYTAQVKAVRRNESTEVQAQAQAEIEPEAEAQTQAQVHAQTCRHRHRRRRRRRRRHKCQQSTKHHHSTGTSAPHSTSTQHTAHSTQHKCTAQAQHISKT